MVFYKLHFLKLVLRVKLLPNQNGRFLYKVAEYNVTNRKSGIQIR